MKRKIAKWVVIITYPILLVALIAIVILFALKNNEYLRLQNTFTEAQAQLNKDNTDKETTIEDLQKDFTDLVEQVNTLKTENKQLKDTLAAQTVEGMGTISGEIFPFISEQNGSFNQYQKVCAESNANANVVYCVTVSALAGDFKLHVPAGDYKVYAEVYPQSDGSRAYYTQGVACAQGSYGEQGCDQNDNKPLPVTVTTGKERPDVNPVMWGDL